MTKQLVSERFAGQAVVMVVLDDHSLTLAGYTGFLGDPSAVQTASAVRQAIPRKRPPASIAAGWDGRLAARPRSAAV